MCRLGPRTKQRRARFFAEEAQFPVRRQLRGGETFTMAGTTSLLQLLNVQLVVVGSVFFGLNDRRRTRSRSHFSAMGCRLSQNYVV